MPTIYPLNEFSRKPAALAPWRAKPLLSAILATVSRPHGDDPSRNPYLKPIAAETLALWKAALAGRDVYNVGAITIAVALEPAAIGQPMGTRHIGYKRHRANTTDLVRDGALISAGLNAYGVPLFRLPSSPEEAELGPCATESEMNSWFRQVLDAGIDSLEQGAEGGRS